MMALHVDGLCKRYPGFALDHVGFGVAQGQIMGFIGRNGAGKTTTIKSLFNYVHPDEGHITFFGLPFAENEAKIKQQVGYVGSDAGYYLQKRLRTLTDVTRSFYPGWDESVYRQCLSRFALDETKRLRELSEGMKVKYQLTLALSHHARLLVLDEPTSGLDPASRDDLMELFLDLAEREGVAILFSTHITGDLEKCADAVTYIQNGTILFSGSIDALRGQYVLVRGAEAQLAPERRRGLIGYRAHRGEFNAMAERHHAPDYADFSVTPATLEDVMVYLERM